MAYKFTERIATLVAADLKAHGRTQQQLADHLGITQPNVSKRLRGESPFTLDELPKIAEFFGTTIEHLLEGRAADNSGQHTVSPAPTLKTPQGEPGSRERTGPTRGLHQTSRRAS